MSISFKDFQTLHNASTTGRAKKINSDMIMKNTWDNDIQSQVCYLYDYYHDRKSEECLKLNDLHPDEDLYKVALPIKFIRHSKQTYDKDQVTFWLQMQPGQICNVEYYEDVFAKRYDAIFPIGLYVDIMHEDGTYNKWLVVDKANYNGNQFPTFEILRCDYLAQWIYNGHKYQCPAVLRSQNSYNSGLWRDYKFQTVEDQQKFAVPMNRDTETLFYNNRMIIDAKVETEPRAWLISKVNRISPNGICRVTLTQDIFDQHKDYIEKDNDGNIIGMWANYYISNVEPTPVPEDTPLPVITSKVICSGRQQIRVGGSAKTFTVTYYDEDGKEIPDYTAGDWLWEMDGQPVPNTLIDFNIIDNKVKIKFLGDDLYIGKVLTVINVNGDIRSSVDVEIIGL